MPEGHFAADARVILMVDRYSGYKAMAQVKFGNVILVFCWAHVRRDFIEVGKGWSELKPWALTWLRRIRALYRHQHQRLEYEPGSAEFQTADAALRQTVADMQTQAATELADPRLREPCRKTLTSLQEHWSGLTRFLDDLRIPLDNNGSERANRGPAVGRKNYYGSGSLWAGHLAAMLFSLFATRPKCGLNPRSWLTWYLESCATAGGCVPQSRPGICLGTSRPNVANRWHLAQKIPRDLARLPPQPPHFYAFLALILQSRVGRRFTFVRLAGALRFERFQTGPGRNPMVPPEPQNLGPKLSKSLVNNPQELTSRFPADNEGNRASDSFRRRLG